MKIVWTAWLQDWYASHAFGDTASRYNNLDTFRINANYFYRTRYGTFGGNIAYFNTFGGRDRGLYARDPLNGSRTGLPNSNGVILQGSYVPPVWDRAKIVVQYTIYNEFNGAGSNYDGFGRSASDNNTLYILAWLMF